MRILSLVILVFSLTIFDIDELIPPTGGPTASKIGTALLYIIMQC